MMRARLQNSALARRLAKGVWANFTGKIWVLIIQLLSVPILSAKWGVDGYGIWLMLSTIPTYIALSNFGLGIAAGVDITQSMAKDDSETALRAFQSVWLFLSAISVLAIAIVAAGALIWLSLSGASQGAFTPQNIAITMGILALYAGVVMQMSTLKIVFQATHKYALGTALFDIVFLLGGLGTLLCAALDGGVVSAAITLLAIQLAGFAIYAITLRRLEPWWHMGWRQADRSTLRRLIAPSSAAFALTLANSFGLQGVVLAIGWMINPAAAATFATARMLTRIPLQFSGLLTRAALPELTRTQTEGNTALTAKIMRLNLGLTIATMLPFTLLLGAFGPTILSQLSKGEMSGGHSLFAYLAIAALFAALWQTLSMPLIAINKQSGFAYAALALYLACAAIPFFASNSLTPLLVATLAAEAILFWRVFSLYRRNQSTKLPFICTDDTTQSSIE
ncbi:MAG: O-antigen/teichoic acid export membrane protein [Halocynthiibacter sp.]|jgi:O-antigen/teichoic acid export membrane protein